MIFDGSPTLTRDCLEFLDFLAWLDIAINNNLVFCIFSSFNLLVESASDPLYGFADREGNIVIPCKYDQLQPFHGKFAEAQKYDVHLPVAGIGYIRLGQFRTIFVDKEGRESGSGELASCQEVLPLRVFPKSDIEYKVVSSYLAAPGSSGDNARQIAHARYSQSVPFLLGFLNGIVFGAFALLYFWKKRRNIQI